MLWETVRLAFKAITRNLLRSFLTVLGIVIGVAAVIAMLTVGQGSQAQVTAEVESLGTNILLVRPGRPMMGPGNREDATPFELVTVREIANLSLVAGAAPTASSSLTAVFGNANITTTVTGSSAVYLEITNRPLRLGRAFTEAEENAGKSVCVIGETVRQALFGNSDPVGELIRLKSISCEVIGLLEIKGASTFGTDQDDVIYMPIRTFQRRVAGNTNVPVIYVAMEDGVSAERGIREIGVLLRELRRIGQDDPDDFNVADMKQFSSILTGITGVLTGLLSSVAAVSLLVGGIGIMNIMLVSVTERTREIGIRLAVGAQAGQVLTQFLVEAIVLSLLGGAIGILLGLGLGALGCWALKVPFAPDPLVVLMAFAFSAAVGVIFGYFPARRAARLDPIEALRYA